MNRPWTAILLGACALSLSILLVAARGDATAAAAPASFSGLVTGWSVDASGTVALRLEGHRADNQPFDLWFSTGANRTGSTNFEELVLQTVLVLSRHGTKDSRLTVIADTGAGQSGRSPEEALGLLGLRRG